MSMMDSDLKKRAKKAALIRLAAPFLNVLQVICVNGADNNAADNNATDKNTDNNADIDADNDAAMQTTDDAAADNNALMQTTDYNTDNDAAKQTKTPQHRRQRRNADNKWTTTQTTTLQHKQQRRNADNNAAIQTMASQRR